MNVLKTRYEHRLFRWAEEGVGVDAVGFFGVREGGSIQKGN